MSLLITNSLTVAAKVFPNTLIFFAAKIGVGFAMQKLLTFFQQKISMCICQFQDRNFNVKFANNFVKF